MPDLTNLNLPAWGVVALLVLGWLSREGIGSYLKWRQSKVAERTGEEQRQIAPYQQMIEEMRQRVGHLEDVLVAQEKKHDLVTQSLRDEHIACLKSQAESSAKIAMLEREVTELRKWRHDLASVAQADLTHRQANDAERARSGGQE